MRIIVKPRVKSARDRYLYELRPMSDVRSVEYRDGRYHVKGIVQAHDAVFDAETLEKLSPEMLRLVSNTGRLEALLRG